MPENGPSDNPKHGEVPEPHPFCVCLPHKTYCDHGKVTPGCPKQGPNGQETGKGNA